MSLWSMPFSDDIMPLFILSICFASLKKFLSNPPLITPSSWKIDVMITALLLFVLMVGSMGDGDSNDGDSNSEREEFSGKLGSDPGRMNLDDEYKQKIFDIFNKTCPYEGNHAKRIKNQWNKENPLQKSSDYRKLYKHAWFVIGEKCEECERQTGLNHGNTRRILSQVHQEIARDNPEDRRLMHETLLSRHPEYRNLPQDWTWSLVHDWHRYYAKDVVPNSLSDWTDVMKASLLYIRNQVRDEGVETRDEIKKRWMLLYPNFNIRPTALESNLRILDARKYQPTKDEKTKRWKWTSQMLTDLMYIATHLDPHDRFFNQKLKIQWDQMNHLYNYMSENNLLSRLYRIRIKDDFYLNPMNVQDAKDRYEKLPPIDERLLTAAPETEPEKRIEFLRMHRGILDKFIEDMNLHDVSGHGTGSPPFSPQHSYGEDSSGEETSSPHEYRNLTLRLGPPNRSPVSIPESGSPEYSTQYHPNVSGYDIGASSSTPHRTRGGHSSEDKFRSLGRKSPPYEYYKSVPPQNSSAPVQLLPFFPEFESPSDYGLHRHSHVSGHDTETPTPIPHSSRRSRVREGGTSSSYEYHQPGPSQNPSTSTHHPRDPTERELLPEYSTQTSMPDSTFNPQSHTPRSRRGEGSSQPKTRRRQS